MPFIGEYQVLNVHIVGFDGGDDLVALDLKHARVVFSLNNEQRAHDVFRVEQWRDAAVTLGVRGWIA